MRCFQCSEFPVQPGDRDEAMGPCPGQFKIENWLQRRRMKWYSGRTYRVSLRYEWFYDYMLLHTDRLTLLKQFISKLPYLGWLRPPVIFPSESVYDGCMTILLSNGSIVAQSGVRNCLFQGELFGGRNWHKKDASDLSWSKQDTLHQETADKGSYVSYLQLSFPL